MPSPPPHLDRIIAHYVRVHRPRAQRELDWFRNAPSLEAAIRRAAQTLLSDGRRDRHHTRRERSHLDKATAKLVAIVERIATAREFAALFDIVHATVWSAGAFAGLYAYDVSLRIGAHLGFLPKRIYLHSGTRDGAVSLGIEVRGVKALWPTDLPASLIALRQLEPYEIEDVLCIYKSKFFATVLELSDDPICWPDEAIEPA